MKTEDQLKNRLSELDEVIKDAKCCPKTKISAATLAEIERARRLLKWVLKDDFKITRVLH